jgi:uncharacterized protein
MADPQGGFYSSLDADSAGGEGQYYLWSKDEITSLLQDPFEAGIFLAAYGIREEGNFAGKNLLRQTSDTQSLAEESGLLEKDVQPLLERLRSKLLDQRLRRPHPAVDDKVLLSWNALTIETLAEAGRFLKREDYLQAAERCADFLLTEMVVNGQLRRSWRHGQTSQEAYLEDYAALSLALLSLYQADSDPHWFSAAVHLAKAMLEGFTGPDGELFDTRIDRPELFVRPKNLQDNATPSGSSLAASALLHLAAFTDHEDWRSRAEAMLGSVQELAGRYPTAFANWLTSMDFATGPVKQVAILGAPDDARTQELIETVSSTYRPRAVLAVSDLPLAPGSPSLLHERSLIDHHPTAYVCEGFICRLPVTKAQDLAAQLAE